MTGDIPVLVAHADWGTNPSKRWIAIGLPAPGGGWVVETPTPVGEPGTLLHRLRDMADADNAILVGFDFPIGIPRSFANRCGISSFLDALPDFGTGQFADFFRVATSDVEISCQRPFYPNAPGGKKQSHLVTALGMESINDLRRQCEFAVANESPAACPLFWTLGANQVGKAAISGWRDVLGPDLRDIRTAVSVWPFDGELWKLITPASMTIVETYPRLYYRRLGMSFAGGFGGKGSRLARERQASALESQMSEARAAPSSDLTEQIRTGFPGSGGDDHLDALVGLIALLHVLNRRGDFPSTAPQTPGVSKIEGWILGRSHA
jgi:hypothetical protein